MTAQVKTDTIQSMMPAMIDIITGIGFFGELLMGGQQIIAGDRTVGEFMSFFTAMTLAFQPLRRLGGYSGSWQIAKVSLGRLYALFDRPSAILPPAAPRRPAPGATTITFEGVVHAYGDVPVLNGLSFTAEAGKTTALVGPSGAGKSTVFNLLTRLVDPVSGRITLGGVPISDIPLAELRAQGMAGIYLDLDGYTEEEQQPTLQALLNAAGCDESDVIISEGGTLCYIPLGKG